MRGLVALALVGAGLTAVGASPASAVEVASCTTTPVVAHRGITDHHIENSRGAVQAAFDADAHAEVDLRELSDGRVVLMHDHTLARTTTGSGNVANKTARQIRALSLDDGQPVPFAAPILRMVRDDAAAHVILDLKALGPVGQRNVRDLIDDYRIESRVEAISRDEALIAGFRRQNPTITTYLITDDIPSVEVAARNGGAHVYPQLITQSWRDEMRAQDVPVSGRIDDTPAGWDDAIAADVTSVMSNSVAGYRQHCSQSL